MNRRIWMVFAVGFAVVASAAAQQSLKDTFKDCFLVGAAINQTEFSEQDERGAGIIKAQFDSISPENALKWQSLHPQPGVYDFAAADQYIAFGEKYHLATI